MGIFADGVVFSTLLPDRRLNLAGTEIDSFWIGSVLVIVLTGLYTALGGMWAVAYNDAVQTVILITGSGLLTIYGLYTLGGWHELRQLCGSDMFNLWKPLIPPGVEEGYAPNSLLWIINNINFQYFSVLITIVSAVVMVAVSYLTQPPEYQKIESLTFGTATAEDRRQTRASWDWREVLASVVVVACILGAYLYFRG